VLHALVRTKAGPRVRFWTERTATQQALIRKINHPNILFYAHTDFCPFGRQHVLAMARRIDPFLQNEFGAAAR
jgi:hypothetical protein